VGIDGETHGKPTEMEISGARDEGKEKAKKGKKRAESVAIKPRPVLFG